MSTSTLRKCWAVILFFAFIGGVVSSILGYNILASFCFGLLGGFWAGYGSGKGDG